MTASFIVRDMSWLSSESKRVGHRSLKQKYRDHLEVST